MLFKILDSLAKIYANHIQELCLLLAKLLDKIPRTNQEFKTANTETKHSSYSDVPNDIKLNQNISLQTLFIFGSRWFMIRKKEHRQRFKTGILSNETTKKKTFLESHVEKNSSREKRRKRYALLEAS